MNGITHQDMREQNIKNIFKEISSNDGITRNEIAPKTGVSLMTVSTIVDALIKRHVVFERSEQSPGKRYGRHPAKLYLNKGGKKIIILDLTEREFCFIQLDLGLQAQKKYCHKYDPDLNYEENLDMFFIKVKGMTIGGSRQEDDHIGDSRQEDDYIGGSRQEDDYIGVGIISPAQCVDNSEFIDCPRLPEFKKINIREKVRTCFEHEMLIGEDVQLATLSIMDMMPELSGKDVFFMHIGHDGVGGAICINNNIYFGCDGYAGDIGQLLTADGDRIEDIISFSAFELEVAKFFKDGETFHPQIKNNKQEVIDVIYKYAGRIASALYIVICLFSPYAVVIESKFRIFGQEFLDYISTYAMNQLVPSGRYKPLILFSEQELTNAAYGIGLRIRERWLLSGE